MDEFPVRSLACAPDLYKADALESFQ